ncbi:hypothetical protein Leryth_014988 [Lithospermum erythrorhizon]|nr:hypothetical protein Leryth_014988 [Lithospermum erythrorhizon]
MHELFKRSQIDWPGTMEAAVVEDNEPYSPDDENHNILIASQRTLSNDVPFLSSTSSEECVKAILPALSSRTNELLYDLNYGVGTSSHASTPPACSPSEGIDALCHQYLSDLQGCGNHHSGTSDTLQQNLWSSQSSFLSPEECNSQQVAVTVLSRSSSINTIDTQISIGSNKFMEQNEQGSHLLSDAKGGEVEDLGEIEPDVIKNVVVDEIWIKGYSSCHMILVVGDGDFSFSACLAKAFGSASNMIATSLDSREFLRLNYHRAISNIQDLERRGCRVIHEMDCTKMAENVLLESLVFDRVVFNFPFAGFQLRLTSVEFFVCVFFHSSACFLIFCNDYSLHQKLIRQFMENAKKMIGRKGEIHITHKSNAFHREWNLEHLAILQGLRLIEAVHFNHIEYPGYRTKTGFGGDTNFNCNPSKTYKFGLRNC